jgi:hypothetical protein
MSVQTLNFPLTQIAGGKTASATKTGGASRQHYRYVTGDNIASATSKSLGPSLPIAILT